jgi:hypothetical protein
MGQQDENASEIKRLIEELTGVLNSMNTIEEQKQEKQFVCEETLNKLKMLNVDPEIVRKIMRRADELKGKTENFKTSQPLYESDEFYKIKRNNDKF